MRVGRATCPTGFVTAVTLALGTGWTYAASYRHGAHQGAPAEEEEMSTFGHQTGDPTHSLRATAVCTTVISAVIQQAETVWIWDKCRPAEVCFQTRLASTPEKGSPGHSASTC